MKAIRFPLMSQKEFVSMVFDSAILSWKEVGDIMKHYNDVSMTSPLPFLQAARIERGRNRCSRFTEFTPPTASWYYDRERPGNVQFSVNKPIKLHGVQHFGSEQRRLDSSSQSITGQTDRRVIYTRPSNRTELQYGCVATARSTVSPF